LTLKRKRKGNSINTCQKIREAENPLIWTTKNFLRPKFLTWMNRMMIMVFSWNIWLFYLSERIPQKMKLQKMYYNYNSGKTFLLKKQISPRSLLLRLTFKHENLRPFLAHWFKIWVEWVAVLISWRAKIAHIYWQLTDSWVYHNHNFLSLS